MDLVSVRRHTRLVSFGDTLIVVVETGHTICRATDLIHHLVANDLEHAREMTAMTSRVGPDIFVSRILCFENFRISTKSAELRLPYSFLSFLF
jgi:hypothetical protein